jgi:hypothetical protein
LDRFVGTRSKIRWIFIETKWLAPPAFSGLRNVARDAGHVRIVKSANAHFVVGRKCAERGAHAVQVCGCAGWIDITASTAAITSHFIRNLRIGCDDALSVIIYRGLTCGATIAPAFNTMDQLELS